MPTAFATTQLAWAVLDFTDGIQAAGQYYQALNTIKWSTDYLMKLIVGEPSTPIELGIIYQVGP
jgi:endoglucanase